MPLRFFASHLPAQVLFIIATAIFAPVLAAATAAVTAATGPLDSLTFGDQNAEQQHRLTAVHSEIIRGGLDQPARRLLPLEPTPEWRGGTLAFSLACDPAKTTYVTVKFWGSDAGGDMGRLMLFCAGKQVGYRHLGDIDQLDIASDEPACQGRFFYTTTPLPLALTTGKTSVDLEIRANGPIWGYGVNWEQYQKPLKAPTRGIYRVYTHIDGGFIPPAGEAQGAQPKSPTVRQGPGEEVLTKLKERIEGEITRTLNDTKPRGQISLQFIAEAWHVGWCSAYHNPKAVDQVVLGSDALYRDFAKDPTVAQADKHVYNADWLGLGLVGNAVRLLQQPLQTRLDEQIDDGNGGKIARRSAWSQMLRASVEWHRRHRRQYTNQTMISDLYLYLANRGVAAVDPAQALPEDVARRYLYEAVGLQPWLGSDNDAGSERTLGDHYFQTTTKGLTKELGYVGYYGEVLDWVTHIYLATCTPGQPASGDAKIKAQLKHLAEARSYFRYPALDADGNRAMRSETIVGWRDTHFPGDVTYGERAGWEGSAIYAAASLLDTHATGHAQQLFADHQFFATVQDEMKEGGLRVTRTLLHIPSEYATLQAQPASTVRLPMCDGEPDFVWSDEEDGVLALKHGDERLYASLYWRARYGINNLARIHYLTPQNEFIATIRQETAFTPSGLTYTRPNWIDKGFAPGFAPPGEKILQAFAGEQFPIALVPVNVKFKAGDENIYAGKGDFYTCRYRHFLIGMNCTADKTFTLPLPVGSTQAVDLVSGRTVRAAAPLTVAAKTTAVLYLK